MANNFDFLKPVTRPPLLPEDDIQKQKSIIQPPFLPNQIVAKQQQPQKLPIKAYQDPTLRQHMDDRNFVANMRTMLNFANEKPPQAPPSQPSGTTTINMPTANSAQTGAINNPVLQNNNPVTQGTPLTAQQYFSLVRNIQTGSLLNNLVQPPPPTIQNPLTHLERISLDRGVIDTTTQQIAEQQANAYRNLRENVSQGSDFMRGANAINQGAMEAQRAAGTQYAEMNNQEAQMNNQIANQEQQIQDQQNQQEQAQNYEIQAQAQAQKNAAISGNLSELSKAAKEEAQYNVSEQNQLRQEAYDKGWIDQNTKLNLLNLAHNIGMGYQQSPEYQKQSSAYLQKNRAAFHDEAVKGTPFEGKAWNEMGDYKSEISRLKTAQETIANAENQLLNAKTSAEKDLQTAQTSGDEAKIKAAQANLDSINAKNNEVQTMKQTALQRYNEYSQYDAAMSKKYNESALYQSFDEEYRKSKGIVSDSEMLQEVKKMLSQ